LASGGRAPLNMTLHLAEHIEGLPQDWRLLARRFAASAQGLALQVFLDGRGAAGATVYPPRPFHALELTPLAQARVAILGQDPYHGPGQAHGLAFSVPEVIRPPPSLRNIFVELQRDCGCTLQADGNLERWARQGVLLLNTVLTVEDGRPASHAGHGWESFSDSVIEALTDDPAPKVFMLWGARAQAKAPLVERAAGRHLLLAANHPSPLAARRPPLPFMGCGHFGKANAFLEERGRGRVDWCGAG